ncbi:uncharacterized protein LOC131957476 [Physella acuta]|uniref:uncharacterized protein LOC131957476 n=1 Tax=Physella acuta TaxID=109671 RepID=UPI0027DD7744|nr:uncharacterized protein LOC131957476 [Physella acuta]
MERHSEKPRKSIITETKKLKTGELIITEIKLEKGLILELNDGTVQVEIFANGLKPGKDAKHSKNGDVYLDWVNGYQGFEVKIELDDRTVSMLVKKMPGKIVGAYSTWHVEKDKLVIRMTKAENISWADKLHTKGIDMGSSSSEED